MYIRPSFILLKANEDVNKIFLTVESTKVKKYGRRSREIFWENFYVKKCCLDELHDSVKYIPDYIH